MEWRGLSSKIESFAVEHPADILLYCTSGRSMRSYLVIRSFVADAFLATLRILHSACNFGIIILNGEILPENEQDLKFHKQIKSTF